MKSKVLLMSILFYLWRLAAAERAGDHPCSYDSAKLGGCTARECAGDPLWQWDTYAAIRRTAYR